METFGGTREGAYLFSHIIRSIAFLACDALSGPGINVVVHIRPEIICSH